MGFSRKELQTSVLNTTRQSAAQIGDLVNEFINITLAEINHPAWAYRGNPKSHLWNFLRRKKTFTTASGTADYVLDRGIDKVALMRQTDSPVKLKQITDEHFFRLVPNPTASGHPRYYRLWENEGVSTRLAAADTVNIVSSSTQDSGSAELSVSVAGHSSGIWRTETYKLNGTTPVVGTITFDADREIFVTKQKNTTGTITASEVSGGTTLVTMSPTERAPKFKIATLYPNPSSASTIYVEYYTFIPTLNNDSDAPIFDENWHYIVRLGAIVKVYRYLNKDEAISLQSEYAKSVRGMVAADREMPDLIEHLAPENDNFPHIHNIRSEDAIA